MNMVSMNYLLQVAIRNIRRDAIKAYDKLQKVALLICHLSMWAVVAL
jgi:hypothetical protein